MYGTPLNLGVVLPIASVPPYFVRLLVDACLRPSLKQVLEQFSKPSIHGVPLACRRKGDAPQHQRLAQAAALEDMRDDGVAAVLLGRAPHLYYTTLLS